MLSFEWILLVTLLTIGIVGGIAAARDAIIDEMGDVAQAALNLDQSFTIELPLGFIVAGVDVGGGSDSGFIAGFAYADCERAEGPERQAPEDDEDS